MKAVTDTNIQGTNAEIRRKSFDIATDLMSKASVDVLLEGSLYERVKPRLNKDHRIFFESVYRIDNSAIGVTGYGSIEAIRWIATAESRTGLVIILTENPSNYQSPVTDIKVMKPSEFITNVAAAESYCKRGIFSSLTDALMSVVM